MKGGINMIIRDAVETDFGEITGIYNEVVLNSTAIYRDDPVPVEERVAMWKTRNEQNYPTLVASEGGAVIGYSSFGDFRAWPGYRFTVEHTVHVHHEWRGRGAGAELIKALFPLAQALGKHVMVGGIDADNEASLRLHARLGFERAALFKGVGFKFGRYLDLVFMQRTL